MLTYRGAPPVFILGSHFTVYTPLCHTHTASEIAPQHSAKHRLLLHASFLAQFLKLIRGQIPELPWEIGSFQPSIAPEHRRSSLIRPGFQSVGHTLLISICWFSSIIFFYPDLSKLGILIQKFWNIAALPNYIPTDVTRTSLVIFCRFPPTRIRRPSQAWYSLWAYYEPILSLLLACCGKRNWTPSGQRRWFCRFQIVIDVSKLQHCSRQVESCQLRGPKQTNCKQSQFRLWYIQMWWWYANLGLFAVSSLLTKLPFPGDPRLIQTSWLFMA